MVVESAPLDFRVTIVVVPRERFSLTGIALEGLYHNTPEPFDLIYLDGHSPRPVRLYLERQAREKGFRLIRVPRFSPPPHLHNLGLREVKTPYMVLLENDVFVRPGWLESLRRCAEETGASAVGPLYLEEASGHEVVHMAGGLAHVEEVDGRRRLVEHHTFQGRTLSEVRDQLRRAPTELVEFHCAFFRTDALREVGGFDEGMKNTAEHVDLCLTLRKAGHQIYLEPAAVVVFHQPPPFAWCDARFYCTRWNETWARQTVAHFGSKWRLDPRDPFLSDKHIWTRDRRREIFSYFWARAPLPGLGRRCARRFLTPWLDVWIGKTIGRPAP